MRMVWDAGTGFPERWWVPHPWKHWWSGWTGLSATWSSWRCPCASPWELDYVTFKGPSNPNYSEILCWWSRATVVCCLCPPPLELAADSLTAHGDSISKRQDESRRLITDKWRLSSEVFKQWSISPCNIELCGFNFMETAWRFLNYSGSACIRSVGDQFW